MEQTVDTFARRWRRSTVGARMKLPALLVGPQVVVFNKQKKKTVITFPPSDLNLPLPYHDYFPSATTLIL